MPVQKIVGDKIRSWVLWLILESETSLREELGEIEPTPPSFTNPKKRLEFLAGRLLIRQLLSSMTLPFTGIHKDPYGKPYLKNLEHHISLSHSYPYVAAIVDAKKVVGIDLEQPKDKLFRIAPRIHAPEELADAGDNLVKHCVYWCAKEALIKVYGKKDLTLSENLKIAPFELKNEGNISGSIIVKDSTTELLLMYQVFDEFVVVFNR
jgi:phosphopantetheinyl transferase